MGGTTRTSSMEATKTNPFGLPPIGDLTVGKPYYSWFSTNICGILHRNSSGGHPLPPCTSMFRFLPYKGSSNPPISCHASLGSTHPFVRWRRCKCTHYLLFADSPNRACKSTITSSVKYALRISITNQALFYVTFLASRFALVGKLPCVALQIIFLWRLSTSAPKKLCNIYESTNNYHP